jgi:hypothetical protein
MTDKTPNNQPTAAEEFITVFNDTKKMVTRTYGAAGGRVGLHQGASCIKTDLGYGNFTLGV